MRWFTCTPVAFGGGPDFFARDSGLLCRGFQAIGCESMAVMPGARQPEDEAGLIRTSFANLESAEWWRKLDVDGVVLYAWGRPKFRKVARAIHEAGIYLVLNQDNGGLVSPLAGFAGWLREQWILSGSGARPADLPRFLKSTGEGLTKGLLITDPLRAAHLRHGDMIACVSPAAAEHYRRLCRIYGGTALAERVKVVPHPVEARFDFPSSCPPKLRQIACVGRWDDRIQKRPALMMEVLGKLLAEDPELRIEIAGEPTDDLVKWREHLPRGADTRVFLRGRVGRDELAELLTRSQVFYSPSAYESFGIAAGEALCSGCSVVAARSPSMAAFEWFVSENSGMLAASDNARHHVEALAKELSLWAAGSRNPASISAVWKDRLHAGRLAGRIIGLKNS